jgi:hypothetical protein
MNRASFVQAIRGPIVLIVVGILFAVQQAGGYAFWRTWPVILIVVGLMKLMERSARTSDAGRDPDGSSYPGGAA